MTDFLLIIVLSADLELVLALLELPGSALELLSCALVSPLAGSPWPGPSPPLSFSSLLVEVQLRLIFRTGRALAGPAVPSSLSLSVSNLRKYLLH